MTKRLISLLLALAMLCCAGAASAAVDAEKALKSLSDDDLFILQYYLIKELRSRGLTDSDNSLLSLLEEEEDASGIWVWVTKSGSKYHRDETCGTSVCTRRMTLEEALEEGYSPCQRCNPPIR